MRSVSLLWHFLIALVCRWTQFAIMYVVFNEGLNVTIFAILSHGTRQRLTYFSYKGNGASMAPSGWSIVMAWKPLSNMVAVSLRLFWAIILPGLMLGGMPAAIETSWVLPVYLQQECCPLSYKMFLSIALNTNQINKQNNVSTHHFSHRMNCFLVSTCPPHNMAEILLVWL